MWARLAYAYSALFSCRENAFFLERTNRLCREGHRYFLAVNHEGFLLEVGLKDAVSATQREADIVAKLLAFSGEITSCCHNLYFHLLFTICTSLPLLTFFVKVKSTLLVVMCPFGYAWGEKRNKRY